MNLVDEKWTALSNDNVMRDGPETTVCAVYGTKSERAPVARAIAVLPEALALLAQYESGVEPREDVVRALLRRAGVLP